MVAQLLVQRKSLQFPIQTKKMIDGETKEYHFKKLYELSLKSVGEIPKIDDLTWEQEQWKNRRMSDPAWTWQRWFVGLYFTEEQKKELELTDKDIAGKGMK